MFVISNEVTINFLRVLENCVKLVIWPNNIELIYHSMNQSIHIIVY